MDSSDALSRSRYRERQLNNFTSSLLLDTAAKLMRVVANKSLSTVQLIEIELSKAYLCSICCLANVSLTVLYYITGKYWTAIDHCTLVTRSQDHSQCISPFSRVIQEYFYPKLVITSTTY